MSDLIRMTAVDVVDGLKRGTISPLDCLDALEARVAEVDGAVNALPTRCFDRARKNAASLMEKPVDERGILAGLPVPIKDLVDVAGVRSTQCTPIYRDRIAETSDIVVTHLEGNGGVVYAMSNAPEFGAGANTFNDVFGATLNPWNTRLSAAGSSGGAAVALATGTAWVAQGSDTGGSLRNPASFCGVVGMRPSPGRVAMTVYSKIDSTLAVEGPMARNVEDLALLFDAMVGEEPGDPISLPHDGTSYRGAACSGWKPKRVAISRDLGIPPVDREVGDIVMAAARRFEEAGVIADLCAARHALETGLGAEDAPEPLQQVALTTAAEFTAQYEARLASCDDPPPTRVPLLDPRGASPPRFEGDELDIDPPTPPTPAHRRSRIAGAALVGLGVGLLGAGGYGLAGMITTKRSGYALVDDAGDGPATPTQLARDAELRDDYAASSRLALGAGIAGGVAAIVGAALLGVSRRHKARSGRLSTIQPTGGGLVLTARF